MDVAVEPLSNYPEAVPTVAEWHFREWGHTDPGGPLEAWTAGMAQQADAIEPPGTLIAVVDGAPVGVVCLVEKDMPGCRPAAGLTAWLKGLYVTPSARRQGVGATLVRRCEAWALPLATRRCTCTASAARVHRPSTSASADEPSTATMTASP